MIYTYCHTLSLHDALPNSLQKGQLVVVPFVIACGKCFFCEKQQYSACDNSNPVDKQDISETLYCHAMSGLFGYSHLTGGYPGGQAEYVRVPFSDVGPIVVPEGMDDEQVLFLSDIIPTGWMAADNADIEEGDTRSEEHTSELQSLLRISYAVFCLKKKNNNSH